MDYKEALEQVIHINCDNIYLLDLRKTIIDALEQVIKHEESFEWCTDCKEYDQEAHCCHRWNKCIRETIKEYEECTKEYWYNKGYSAGLKRGCEVKLTKEQYQFIVDALELYADCSMTTNNFKKHMEIELKIQELISVLQEGYRTDDEANI